MDSKILFEICRFLIPIIQVFGVYIIVNGHISPGGGFAGGTVLGASLITYRIVYGKNKADSLFSNKRLIHTICISLTIYGLLKGIGFIFNVPTGTPGNIISGGLILPLNILIGLVVSSVMYLLFKSFYEGEM